MMSVIEQCPLPITGLTDVADPFNNLIKWPKHLIHEDNQEPISKKKRKIEEQIDKSPLISDKRLHKLSDKCKELHDFFARLPIEDDAVTVEFDKEAFSYEENHKILVTRDDVTQLLRGAWLNISVLQVWMQYLSRICREENRHDTFTFMCPQFVSSLIVESEESVMYMSKVMLSSQTKRFILAPYHQDDHWMLLVICPAKDVVIVYDSIRQYRKLVIRPQLNMAFNHYKNAGGRNKGNIEFKWLAAKCAQQNGGTDCGYFVMRYMLDIIKQYYASVALTKEFKREVTYTKEEIDTVRTLWADYVLANNS